MANYKKDKKYHFTYKTTNLINNRYYLGMHSTNCLDDGYLGSGKRLYYELKKYGRDNFKFEILKQFNSREELVQAEVNLVSEEVLKDPNCLNIVVGGSGGNVGKGGEHLGGDCWAAANRYWKTEEGLKKKSEIGKKVVSKRMQEGSWKLFQKGQPGPFLGKHHSEESKRKIGVANSVKQKGERNSQFGKCWITNEIENKKIHKTDSIPEGWRLGRKFK